MNTFEFFKEKLDMEISQSVRAQLWFQEPNYEGEYIEFDDIGVWCGATRACLVSKDWDYVVKFTYTEDMNGDPCERECETYENAVDSGVEIYFAKPQFAGTYLWKGKGYKARRIYRDISYIDFCDDSDEDILERIEEEGIGEVMPISICLELYEYPKASKAPLLYYTPSKELSNRVKRSGTSFAMKNTSVAAYFVEKYGYEEFQKIAEFLEWNGVNDLHCGNVGVIGEKIVFIDYGGFYDDEDTD